MNRERENLIRSEAKYKRAIEQMKNEVEEANSMAKEGIPIEQIAKIKVINQCNDEVIDGYVVV